LFADERDVRVMTRLVGQVVLVGVSAALAAVDPVCPLPADRAGHRTVCGSDNDDDEFIGDHHVSDCQAIPGQQRRR
jgi:hypothetical protein